MLHGGVKGSTKAWAWHMSRNPGAQRRAFDAVLSTSRQMDRAHGTNITQDVWRNIIEGRFKVRP
jgi:hypothetical protein